MGDRHAGHLRDPAYATVLEEVLRRVIRGPVTPLHAPGYARTANPDKVRPGPVDYAWRYHGSELPASRRSRQNSQNSLVSHTDRQAGNARAYHSERFSWLAPGRRALSSCFIYRRSGHLPFHTRSVACHGWGSMVPRCLLFVFLPALPLTSSLTVPCSRQNGSTSLSSGSTALCPGSTSINTGSATGSITSKRFTHWVTVKHSGDGAKTWSGAWPCDGVAGWLPFPCQSWCCRWFFGFGYSPWCVARSICRHMVAGVCWQNDKQRLAG